MSNNQNLNNDPQQKTNSFAKDQGKKMAKLAGKKAASFVLKKVLGAVSLKAAPILLGIVAVVILVLAVIAVFAPDITAKNGKTSDAEIKERLTEYVELANGISSNAEWLIALDMAIHENSDLLDYNINENAYHSFGLHYEKFTPEREKCNTRADGTERCRTIPEKIIESVTAEGKEPILSFFNRKGLPKDDIIKALNEIRSWKNVRLSVYGMPLEFAKSDAQLKSGEKEYVDDILEMGYVPEIYDEYEVTLLNGSYLGIGASISCSATKDIDRTVIDRVLSSAGVFKNHTNTFLETADKYGIDPILFIAIALHETGFGTSNAVVNKNNPGGLMNPNGSGLFVYATLEDGIESMGKTLHNRIIRDGKTTISSLGSVYAPVGALNDPTNLNQYWVSNVSDFVNSLGGLTMNCDSYQGNIAFSGDVTEAAKIVASSGTRWIGNSQYVFGGGRNQSDILRGHFDCSSFVHWAFAQAGIDLGPLTATSTETLNKIGKRISINDIQVGDIIFWDSYKKDGHVGIYVGNGQFIGAQTSTGVGIVNINDPYWSRIFSGHVRRILS